MYKITIDDLKEVKLIWHGPFGTVMLCVYEPINTFFAVKNIEYKKVEATHVDRKLANLVCLDNHPSFVQYYYHETREINRGTQQTRIVLEYCEGGDIQESVIRSRPETLSLGVRQKWVMQMTEGLRYLHSKDIVHRDFNAANVLLTSTDLEQADAKMCALGIFNKMEDAHALDSEMIIGKCISMYFAPEQLSAEYNEKVDVWTLGIFAHELFTYTYPFSFRGLEDLQAKQSKLRDKPFITSNVHPALSDFIRLCLTYDPNQRPSAEDLLSHPFFTVDLSVPVQLVQEPPTIDYATAISRDVQQAEAQLQNITYLRGIFGPEFGKAFGTNYRAYLNNQLGLIQKLRIPQSEEWINALNSIKARLSELIR